MGNSGIKFTSPTLTTLCEGAPKTSNRHPSNRNRLVETEVNLENMGNSEINFTSPAVTKGTPKTYVRSSSCTPQSPFDKK